jgi:cyclohexadieny/prephenate dehydrogenase
VSEPLFERVAIIGLGLLGGSVAAAAKRKGVATAVVGSSRCNDVREFALRRGWVDEAGSPIEVARGADLVILATPVFAMADVLGELASALNPPAIVTDVGSVKAQLADTLPGLLPSGIPYVGSHPIAGSHERGIEFARHDLFEDAPCVVTGGEDPAAVERVCSFWRALGARVVLRDPVTHDAQVAWTSHVPHSVAYAFAAAFRDAPIGAGGLAGSGFRDFTRIAQSDPELWSDILTANRKALAAPLAAVGSALGELSRAIEANDQEWVERWLAAARDALALLAPPTFHARPPGDVHPVDQTANPRSESESPPGQESEDKKNG